MAPKLKQVIRLDSMRLDSAQFTKEGFLVDNPVVTSCGVFVYTNPDGSTRRELRLPEHVFDQASLDSYEGKPIIITHQAGKVTKSNVDDEYIGTILSPGVRDGDDVRARVIIHDTNAMRRSGLKELSLGYTLTLEETPGEWNGEPYDAIQTNIRVNHLALVEQARAGEHARLNIDSKDQIIKGGTRKMAKAKGKKTNRKPNSRPAHRYDSEEEKQDSENSTVERHPPVCAAQRGCRTGELGEQDRGRDPRRHERHGQVRGQDHQRRGAAGFHGPGQRRVLRHLFPSAAGQ